MSRSIDRVAATLFLALTASSGANAADARPDATVTCSIPQPCALYKNANGIGLSATSAKSEGLYGSTTFSATSTSNRTFGVEGVDASTNKNRFNSGLYGLSPYGYGVYASSANGTAVYATSTSGVGVRAASTSGFAINAASGSNFAINATSSSNTALLATTLAQPTEPGQQFDGLKGVDSSTGGSNNDGVLGVTTNGFFGVEGDGDSGAQGGVIGGSTTGVGVAGVSDSSFGVEGIAPYAVVARSDSYPLTLTNAAGDDEFYVNGQGDVYVHGSYNTFVHTRNGGEATAFMTRSTTSNLEDSGTAELTGGIATVRLDPTFAAAIDPHAVYQVFLTPGGDTHGLFVARKTPMGFVVRETEGGRGTLSFDYRILAATPGQAGERMAPVTAASLHEPRVRPSERERSMLKTFPFATKPFANK